MANQYHKPSYEDTIEIEQVKTIISKLIKSSGGKTPQLEELKRNLERQLHIIIEKQRHTEKKYQHLYENAPDLYRTIDTNGRILECNNTYARYFGYSKDEIIGKSIFDHVTKDSLDKMRKSFESWKKEGRVEKREINFKRKDGSTFIGLLSATNLYDNGKLIGSITVIKDITEIYQARQALERSQKIINLHLNRVKKMDQAKDEFLAMVTHELKTPLVPIKGYADILLSENLGPLNDMQKNRLQVIKSSSNSLLKLVSDLLDVQKIDLGRLKLDMQMHNLTQIIQNTANKIKPAADSKGITITLDLQPDVLCICDNVRIEQVLVNLLLNSIDFSPPQTGKVLVKLSVKNNRIYIVVKDNGIGIIKESLAKIFVKFYQIDTSVTREHGGTGLGLSVCKGIVEANAGKIWAESEGKNNGAEIHLMLPLIQSLAGGKTIKQKGKLQAKRHK